MSHPSEIVETVAVEDLRVGVNHAFRWFGPNGEVYEKSRQSGRPARCVRETTEKRLVIDGHHIPVTVARHVGLRGLPEQVEGVAHIVSRQTAFMARHRTDLYVPNDFVMDEAGRRVTGVRELLQFAW